MTVPDTQPRANLPARDAEVWREGLLTRVGYIHISIFAATVLFSAVIGRPTAFLWYGIILMAGQSISYLLSRRQYDYRIRAWTSVSAMIAASAGFYLFAGYNPGPVLAGAFSMVLTALLLGRSALLGVLLVMLVFLVGITTATWAGWWPGPSPSVFGTPTPVTWLRTTLVSTLFWAGIAFSVLYVVRTVERTVERLRETEKQRLESDEARRNAEAIAVEAQKLEAVGQLAAGIAHDFNNALLVLRGWTDILRDTDSPELREQANSAIEQAIDQSEQLTKQLLAFGRKQAREPRYLPIAELVERTAETLSRVISSRISLRVECQQSGYVFADEGQLQQVMFNLVLNARDALPDSGEICIRLREPAQAELATVAATDDRNWIVLEVEDNGVGMNEAVKERIFEPFYTTKEVGKGTGLGLSTVFGIVKQSDGHISVWSEAGRGSRFIILLSRVEVAPPVAVTKKSQREALPRPNRRVLVLEDDASVRKLIVFALTHDNFTVIEASDGDEALDLLRRQEEPVDILCTDAVFPGAGLDDVIAAFEQANPEGQVLICSGYVSGDIAVKCVESGLHEHLQKPFTAEQLSRQVRSLLGLRHHGLPSKN